MSTEPNSIDMLYPPDHPRERSDVERLRREQKMREALVEVETAVGWVLRLLEQHSGRDWPDVRHHAETRVQTLQRLSQEARKHG